MAGQWQTFIIVYKAPVYVECQLDDDGTFTVTKVTVGDESVELDEGVGNLGVMDLNWNDVDDDTRDKILELEKPAVWPAWDFG